MLLERNVDQETSEKAMADIQVVEVLTSEELIEVLKAFEQQMTDGVQAALKTKVVMVDSLAACFVDHRGMEMRRTRDSLLTEVACRVKSEEEVSCEGRGFCHRQHIVLSGFR
ncbi:GL18385 [Drosophila persimilis]|uniref:GL18385 n=1 Tax=Drosophila persimilis TaxID=7234 RepID=B4H9N9_DROPE|nr:GL18385 [Drosophila persimilis]